MMDKNLSHIDTLVRERFHLSDEIVEAYITGNLDIAGDAAVKLHLSHCTDCRTEVQDIENAINEFEQESQVEVRKAVRESKSRTSGEFKPGSISSDRETTDLHGEMNRAEGRLWLGDKSYRLKPTQTNPELLRVHERLYLADLVIARAAERHSPGTGVLRVEWEEKSIIISLANFDDVSLLKGPVRLAAAKRSNRLPEFESENPEHSALNEVFRCELETVVVEIHSDRSGAVFLRVSPKKR